MARCLSISKEDALEYIRRVEAGEPKKATAKAMGFNYDTMRHACRRHGLEFPKRVLAVERIVEFEEQILAGTISQHQIAEKLGITQCRVSNLYKELGYSAISRGCRPGQNVTTQEERDRISKEVIAHIEEHGGYVNQALKTLGYPQHYRWFVNQYAKEIGFDYKNWRFAHRRYGYWVTLPGHAQPVQACDYLLKARCTKCGSVHEVRLINLKTGASTMCWDCSLISREFQSVECVETGKQYRSIMACAKALGIGYQTFRLKLSRQGEYVHEGKTYVVIVKVYSKDISRKEAQGPTEVDPADQQPLVEADCSAP